MEKEMKCDVCGHYIILDKTILQQIEGLKNENENLKEISRGTNDSFDRITNQNYIFSENKYNEIKSQADKMAELLKEITVYCYPVIDSVNETKQEELLKMAHELSYQYKLTIKE